MRSDTPTFSPEQLRAAARTTESLGGSFDSEWRKLAAMLRQAADDAEVVEAFRCAMTFGVSGKNADAGRYLAMAIYRLAASEATLAAKESPSV